MSALYTPAMLAAAVELADYPLLQVRNCEAAVRSDICGSAITMHLTIDHEDQIAAIGMQVRACAVGQASAAVFARHVKGLTSHSIAGSATAMEQWLKEGGPQPDWPELDLIAPALAFPARHSAMLLPWTAAKQALSSVPASR